MHVFQGQADDFAGSAAHDVGCCFVDLQDTQGFGVTQCDGHRGGFNDALQGGLGLCNASFGLTAALNVEQGVGELATRHFPACGHHIAHHPKLAPVMGFHAALKRFGLAFNQLVQVMGLQEGVVRF